MRNPIVGDWVVGLEDTIALDGGDIDRGKVYKVLGTFLRWDENANHPISVMQLAVNGDNFKQVTGVEMQCIRRVSWLDRRALDKTLSYLALIPIIAIATPVLIFFHTPGLVAFLGGVVEMLLADGLQRMWRRHVFSGEE